MTLWAWRSGGKRESWEQRSDLSCRGGIQTCKYGSQKEMVQGQWSTKAAAEAPGLVCDNIGGTQSWPRQRGYAQLAHCSVSQAGRWPSHPTPTLQPSISEPCKGIYMVPELCHLLLWTSTQIWSWVASQSPVLASSPVGTGCFAVIFGSSVLESDSMHACICF